MQDANPILRYKTMTPFAPPCHQKNGREARWVALYIFKAFKNAMAMGGSAGDGFYRGRTRWIASLMNASNSSATMDGANSSVPVFIRPGAVSEGYSKT